ncbi:MAG: TlpA disulfide reductase family protein [Myxococcota bacterium]
MSRKPGIRLFVAVLALVACKGDAEIPTPREAIPFELTRLDGTVLNALDLRGRHVLVDFWATWCAPCILEIPELNALHERYRGDGVEILAISIDDLPLEELGTWVRENGIEYPVALGTEELARRYGALGFPFHVLLSPSGSILESLSPGFHDRRELGELLDRHLSG